MYCKQTLCNSVKWWGCFQHGFRSKALAPLMYPQREAGPCSHANGAGDAAHGLPAEDVLRIVQDQFRCVCVCVYQKGVIETDRGAAIFQWQLVRIPPFVYNTHRSVTKRKLLYVSWKGPPLQ